LGSATVVIRGDDGDRFGRYGDHGRNRDMTRTEHL
jgi:hypothetical protein